MIHPEFMLAASGVIGLTVGSFLNVAIYRLPVEGVGVNDPPRSRCSSCGHTLAWYENIPVVSWALQAGKCRHCGSAVSWRYPFVELLTAALWLLAAWRAGDSWALALTWCLVLSGLVVATFVDFDHFEIPDEVSIGGMVLAPFFALAVPALHADTWIAQELTEGWEAGLPVDRVASLVGCLAGMAVGAGVLLAIGWVGERIYGREAMGLGDVKLLSAAGGFVGPGGALLALMCGTVLASIAGIGNMFRYAWLSRARARERGRRDPWSRSIRIARVAGRYVPFGPYLAIGIGIVLLAWNDVLRLIG